MPGAGVGKLGDSSRRGPSASSFGLGHTKMDQQLPNWLDSFQSPSFCLGRGSTCSQFLKLPSQMRLQTHRPGQG